MTDFALALLKYQPQEDTVRFKFRPYQVEALLNQSAELVERCVATVRELRALQGAREEQLLALEMLQEDLLLDEEAREDGLLDRAHEQGAIRRQLFQDTAQPFDASMSEASKLYHKIGAGEGQGEAGWARSGQALREKEVEKLTREAEISLNHLAIAWAHADRQTALKRIATRRRLINQRATLATAAETFDYEHQAKLVESRLELAWMNLSDRLPPLWHGLQAIVNYEEAPPQTDPKQPLDANITKLYVWVQRCIEWMIAYAQREQGFTKTFSLGGLLQGRAWVKADDAFESTFDLPANAFDRHDNVRLRGLSASLSGAGSSPWTIYLKPPSRAIYFRAGRPSKILQDVPACCLGRVEDFRHHRSPEICGRVSLVNASPIGQTSRQWNVDNERKWHVKIERPAGSPETFAQLIDVRFEMESTGVPRE